jgi:O-acetyl-ADP-ribose deacetylase (regulator of RNase III)
MTVERKVGDRVIKLVRGDVAGLEIEAFVFDITSDLKLGSGYGGAIAQRGGKRVQDELTALGTCPTGSAVVTSAGEMKSKFIIHANGPKYHEPDTEAKLRKTTQAVLRLADDKGIQALALPPIGTGIYQVPLDLCARVMVDTVVEHLKAGETSLREVVFVALDSREYKPLAAKIQGGA